jgi:hypothetical protein
MKPRSCQSSTSMLFRRILGLTAAILATTAVVSPVHASGHIDASTVVSAPHGPFNGVQYRRYEAMFEGVTSNNRPYRVPCQIIAPENPSEGSGLLLFDWLVVSTAHTIVGQEQADARYTMTDEFLFGLGLSYATVRCDPFSIGKSSPYADRTRPWSDDLLDTSTEFITSAGDEFDIVVDFNNALRTDPIALSVLGAINRRLAFGYSASGGRLRGLLRLQMGVGLFDFSLVGGVGSGYTHPTGNGIVDCWAEKAPLPGAGLEIDLQTETDVILFKGQKARHEEANYRNYEFAGTSHIRDVDVLEFGLPDHHKANPAEWTPFIKALFVAGINWCDGITPPPTTWFGAPNDPSIARDAKGNALVRYVGGLPVITNDYRLPEVAVGENQYIPVDPSYLDGTFLGAFRMIAGGRVDLSGTFTDHDAYVAQVTYHARDLQSKGYLLEADADKIIERASDSNIGQ